MSEQAASAFGQSGSLGSTEMSSGDDDSICETCQKIDFHDLLQNPRSRFERQEGTETSPHIIRYSDSCKLCSLIFLNCPSYMKKDTFGLRSSSLKKRWSVTGAGDTIVLESFSLQDPSAASLFPLDDVFCKLASDDSQELNCAQPVQKIWDRAKARYWLDACTKYHGSVCKGESLLIPGMNLIDCEDMTIVKASREMRWLALSYVWGVNPQTKDHSGYRAGTRISSDIPATIGDSIGVTLQLGYRYLWVDEYCIDQKDDNHRENQISKMDQIYRGADLTIVAAAGGDKMYGLPGFGSRKRRGAQLVYMKDVVVFSNGIHPWVEIGQSKWSTRAWTFQERLLSKRVLAFTGSEMSFHCQASFWEEGLGYPDPNSARHVGKDLHPSPFFEGLADLESSTLVRGRLTRILQSYSGRQTTKEADTLAAFLGVLNHVRRFHPTVQLLRGLPFFKITPRDPFEELVTAALSWHSWYKGASSSQRRSEFPSWTWAGWSAQADFWQMECPSRSGYLSPLRRIKLKSSSGHVVMSSALYRENIQRELDTVTLIEFKALMVPAADFSITKIQPADLGNDGPGFELRVQGRRQFPKGFSQPCTSDELILIENIRIGIWSCFILCGERSCNWVYGGGWRTFLLVVRWEADQVTAERISSFQIFSSPSEDARLGLLGKGCIWRLVKLI